jgi:hypothetical protein
LRDLSFIFKEKKMFYSFDFKPTPNSLTVKIASVSGFSGTSSRGVGGLSYIYNRYVYPV